MAVSPQRAVAPGSFGDFLFLLLGWELVPFSPSCQEDVPHEYYKGSRFVFKQFASFTKENAVFESNKW